MLHMTNQHVWIIALGIFSVGLMSSASAQTSPGSEFSINDPLFRETLDMDSYSLQIGDEAYNIYYAFVWDYNDDGTFVKVSSILLNPENKSLVMNIENIKDTKYLDVVIPNKLLSAEDYKYTLLIDGVEKNYEIDWFPEHTILGLIVPVDSGRIEIVGTHVIPEFGQIVSIVLLAGIASIVFLTRRNMSSLLHSHNRI